MSRCYLLENLKEMKKVKFFFDKKNKVDESKIIVCLQPYY